MASLHIGIFVISCIVLAISGNWLVKSLSRIAHFLGWREFVVSFFLMSFVTSLPELLVGVGSALRGIPELSFGNIIGQNIIHFSLAIAICVFILKELDVKSHMVQISALFTGAIALLPLILILDGSLSRPDGVVLMLSFLIYAVWLFSKKEHFIKVFHAQEAAPGAFLKQAKNFFKNVIFFLVSAALLLLAAQGMIVSATFFASAFSLPLIIVGVLLVSIGTALPETYFAVTSAKRGNTWMLVGNLLGSTVVSSTLVLGLVAILQPIVVTDFSPYFISRFFLMAAAFFFVWFLRTGEKITKKEGLILLFIYVLFVLAEIFRNAI